MTDVKHSTRLHNITSSVTHQKLCKC